MSVVDVPGAQLYGSGPLLVMIPGAGGAADVFRMVTAYLAADYTVVIYDRRGFSRSRLDGPQDYDRRLETDAADIRRLIEHLGNGPATVFGASSGAVVALELLIRHPSVVRTLVPSSHALDKTPQSRPHKGGQRMLTAETTIQTTNASRYLVQLCKHATKIGHGLRHLHARMAHARPEVLDVDWSDTHGNLTLSWGRCVLDANPTTLTVRIEADSEENLRRVQDLVAADLERFGRRDQLSVTWQQVQPDEAG